MATTYVGAVLKAEREAYVDREDLTLDGQPARILSSKSDFAIVVEIGPSIKRIEYSWHAARNIIATRGGAFRS